jgi:hypothetical protein
LKRVLGGILGQNRTSPYQGTGRNESDSSSAISTFAHAQAIVASKILCLEQICFKKTNSAIWVPAQPGGCFAVFRTAKHPGLNSYQSGNKNTSKFDKFLLV